MKQVLLALAATAALSCALPAHAQFQKPGDAIEYRQSGFTILATHFKRVSMMAQGKTPFDAKLAAENTAVMMAVAKLPFSAFPEGSTTGHPTAARAEIWKEADKFREASEKMISEVAKLDAAARAGNLDQIKAAVGGVGQSCKACHDSYKDKHEH
ncbi:cytochrome c [Paucibacter sp. APW11]|uniref:Cytochrome c n=1 Tax=Roseateles aquae TaxID=3077235 RepID=A0ABU3PC13_9BURK|nr:cytochrome c [Paucibacter sp. APW11]MDT9000063.1 cytochrome c [Paucibacter sp. APW11]